MEERSSSERKSLLIKTILIVILLLLALLSTVLYVFLYPKTTVYLYDDYQLIRTFKVKKYSKLSTLPTIQKEGYTFINWTYEDGEEVDTERELDSDYLSLYANYSINSYRITYNVQVLDPITGKYIYKQDVEGCESTTYKFGEAITLPDGKVNGVLREEFLRRGLTFRGWTTKVYEESDSDKVIYPAGQTFYVPAGNTDLYAYWEKNDYQVVLYTGIEYEMEGNLPKRDENNEYIIKNDLSQIREVTKLKYLDNLSTITDRLSDMTLDESIYAEEAKEYKFMGWYLDPDYTIKASDYVMELNVDDNDIPYLKYQEGQEEKAVYATLVGNEYKFQLYSKWERISYTLSFNKNTNRSSGKIASIQMYNSASPRYGQYYDFGILFGESFNRTEQSNALALGKAYYYHTLDLSSEEITSKSFLESNNGYRFVGWTTNSDSSVKDNEWFYQWTQSTEREASSYENPTYKHSVSSDVTLYAQWSKIYTITFADSTSINKKTFYIEGIEGEWFTLPGTAIVVDTEHWTKDYSNFAGWTPNPNSELVAKYYEKNADGSLNTNFKYTISRSNAVLYAIWEKEKYTITFYLNYGGGQGEVYTTYSPVYGGSTKAYPSTPTRTGYIFDGWSLTQYPDNTLNKTDAYTSAKSFKVVGDAVYYASWTMNYQVTYNAHGGSGALPTSRSYSENFRDLKMTVPIGSGNRLEMAGHNFKGWVLKGADGSLNTDVVFSSGKSVVFDYVNNVCYISSNPNETYPIYLEGSLGNTVTLYAYWEPKEFDIKLIDTLNDDQPTVYKAKYGQDFTFPEISKEGYKFSGWAVTRNGTVLYTAGAVMPGSSVITNYTFYSVYTIQTIELEYWILNSYGDQVQYTKVGNYTSGSINFGAKIYLPTPTSTDYGNDTFEFSYWYYLDGDNEVKVYNEDIIQYEGDKLILWAKFEKQQYTIQFEFTSPTDKTVSTTISEVVEKGSRVDEEFYDKIIALVESFISTNAIKEYSFSGLYNEYSGNYPNPASFVVGKNFNATDFPSFNVSKTLKFKAYWEPNEVKFVYRSGESNYTENSSYHTGLNYESTSTVTLQGQIFDMGEGINITRWYIKNAVQNKYFDIGANLIGGEYTKVSELSSYITWVEEGDTYVGYVYLYAETEQVFEINYYKFNGSQVELIESTSQVYDSENSTITLLSGSNATYGDLKFNGWRVNSMGGELIKDGMLTISPTKFPSYKINLYADMSFDIIYTYLDTANSNRVTELKRDTINYHNGNSYVNTVAITSLPSMDIPSGYTYYGLKYNDVVYSASQITSGDLNITYSGYNHTILVYLTTTITVTYTVGTDETFADGTTEAKTFDYSIGYDGIALSTMVVENVKAKKSGYVFSGYSIKNNDSIDSTVYVIGDILNLAEDTTFVAIFTLPTAGNITAYITYSNGLTGDSYKTESVEVRNGKSYTLVSGESLSWNRDTYQIIGWSYDGNTYNFGDTFEIPLTIDEGDVFVFTAIWDEKYTLNFDCVYVEASNKPSSMSIVNNTEYKLSTVPYIDSQTVFKYWTYTVDGQEIIIKNGDTIIFNKNALGYNYEGTFEGTIHTFPTISNQWNYTFTAVWDKQEFTLTLIVTDPNTSTTHSYTQVAYYGDSFDARELLDETALSFETDASGIIGWSETDGGSLNPDIILNIKSNLTLYAVWSTKLVLSYAEADTTFGYKDDTTPEKEYYFANELLTFKTSVIKNIYKKGVNTVYYENGNYIVYTDNPSSTEYYAVVGYKITYTGGSKDIYFDVDNYTFVAPDSDAVLTPIFEIVYRVDFYENGSDSTKLLDTEYVYKQNSTYSIDLSGYTASRTNYNFVGWNTDPDAQESLTSLLNISSNTNVYAVWESKLVARFRMNGTSIFTINFDKTGKIPSSQLNYYLSLTDSPLNNYLNIANIANNPNTYKYNNLYYYLNGFIYNSAVYTQEDLCKKEFTSDIYIDLDMKEIYVVEYSIGEVTDAEGDINTMTYIMTTGELTSTGTQTYTLPEIAVTRPYYYASGWTIDDSTIYAENKSLTADELKKLISSAINQTITLYVNWSPKSYNIQLNLLVDSDENLIDPFTIYSNISSGEEITWTQQNQYAVDISGNAYKKDGSSELSLTFGTTFYLSAPSTTLIGDYSFIGWSTEILELGEIPETYYETYASLAQVTIGVDLLEKLDGNTIKFYPVYGLNEKYLLLQTNNGYATYSIEKDPQYFDANGNVIGFVHYHADHEGTNVTTESYTYVPMTFFNTLTITADKPYDNYKFEKFTGVGTTSESENTRLIDFSDLNDYEASSYSYLVVSYIEKTLTIEVTLAYTNALKTGTDTSTISIGGVALNASTLTGTITISAVSSGLEYNFDISDNYKLKSVTSGTGENAKIVSLTSGLIKLSELYVDGEDSNILITLAPKTYTINFVLNSGKIGTKISISNESYFVDSEVELTGSTLEVVANSVITLPTPTRDNYEFIGWQIDGADYEESTYTVTKDVSFNAMFVRNIYTLNYYVEGKLTQVSFVGGSTINIGAGVAEYDVEGKKLVGWTDNTYTYAIGQSFNTSKKDYAFYAIIEGEPVIITYNYGSDNSISSNVTHEYGKDVTLPTQDELENSEIENMNLYGWQVEGSTEIFQAGEIISFAWLSSSYVESLTLNAVYYVSYTFTVEYDLSDCTNVINSEAHIINAKDQFGAVASSDLMVNVSSTEPKNSNPGLVFAGYEVYFDGEKIGHDLIACGGILTFNAPSLTTLAYTYTLVPTWANSNDAVTIDFYITNPEDTSTTLKLTQDSEEKDSISTAFVVTNKLTNSYLPTNNYTSNWVFEMGGEFTADYSNFVAWKLIGFNIYSGDTLVTTIYLSDSASASSRNIAGYSEYSAYTIWEERYFVNYYDNNGDILDNYSAYYDKNASVKLLNKTNYNYEKDGYTIVGFADSLNKEINATSDYFDYEYTIVGITTNYSLYPAFAKLYTINFSVSEQALIDALGDSSNIHVDLNKSLIAYVGFGEIQIDDYFVVSYNGQGYEFKGYRLSDTIYNEDSSLLDGTYSVVPSDADENGVITIYAVWERLSYDVTFHVNARKNDTNSTLVSSTTITLEYLYNQTLNEHEDWSSVIALQTLDYFNYTDMSINPDGSTKVTETYVITSDANIYINFDPIYRLKYNLTEGATVVEGYELPTEKVIELGDEIYCELDYNNVFLNGSSPNYWYAENNRWVNFFESDPHVITASDLANSNSDYIINLLIDWSQANYTVNLYYIDDVETFESRYSSSSDGQIIATSTDPYITATLTAGDAFYYLNEDNEVASEFDNYVPSGYSSLYDLLIAFEDDGFRFTGSISINNASTISAIDYKAQTYNGGEAFSHDIYLIYQPNSYRVIVANVIVDSELNFVSFSDSLVSFAKINDAENPTYLMGIYGISLTKYDTLTRVELTNIVISNNQNYKLVGWYSASNTDQMYDEEGYFNNSYVPTFVDLLSVDGITSVGTDSYMFTSAFTIFALYQERAVDINVTIESEDSIVDDLSAKIYLNGTLDTTSATVVDGIKTISIKNVKFGQTVKIAESISNSSYELQGFRYSGTFLNITEFNTTLSTLYVGEITELNITIVYKLKDINLYFKTSYGSFKGSISSITYTDKNGSTQTSTGITSISNTYNGLEYNLRTVATYGSVISSSFAVPVLNNYTFTGWKVNGSTFESLTLTDTDYYFEAVYEAVDVTVQFYTQEGQVIDSLTMSDKKYGDSIILPYAIIDLENSVSTGWDSGEWGEEIQIYTTNNSVLENNTLKITAVSVNKYYIIFANSEGYTFDISAYPQTRASSTLYVVPTDITIGKNIEYTIYSGVSLAETTNKTSAITTLYSKSITLPDAEVPNTSAGIRFVTWVSEIGRELGANKLYSFFSGDITDEDSQIITMYTKGSDLVDICFYITNPLSEGETYTLYSLSDMDESSAVDFFPISFNINNTSFADSKLIDTVDTNGSVISWSNDEKRYFIDGSDNLLETYEFIGWSTAILSPVENPAIVPFDDNIVLLYNWDTNSTKRTVNNDACSELYNIIKATDSDGNVTLTTTFYAVWEVKRTVTFDASGNYENSFVETYKYGNGVEITMPNPTTIDLRNGNNKWIGWTDGAKDYLFDDGYTFIVPTYDITLTPLWTAGVNVYFDTNFDSSRTYFATTMQYYSSIDSETIAKSIGIPNITEDGYVISETKTINNVNFASIYKEGDLWAINSVIDISKYSDSMFSHIVNGTSVYAGYAVNGREKYFYLAGWELNGETYDSSYTISEEDIMNGQDLIFNAIWKPVEMSVSFYYDDAAVDTRSYKNDFGSTISVTVPFGYMYTNKDYSNKGNYIYLYDEDGEAEAMSSVQNNLVGDANKPFYRFMWWADSALATGENVFANEKTDIVDANSVSRVMVDDIKLYPVFYRQYRVEFRDTNNNLLDIQNDTNYEYQYVIDGENIVIKDRVSNLIDDDIIRKIYYLDSSSNNVTIYDRSSASDISSTLAFSKSNFKIIDDRYIQIFVDIEITVNAYVPNASNPSTAVTLHTFEMVLNTSCNIGSISGLSIGESQLSAYGDVDFDGWYFGENASSYYALGSDSYLLTGSRLDNIKISVSKSSGKFVYTLYNNAEEIGKVTLGTTGLVVNIFAKLLTTTTVTLKGNSSDLVLSYAKLQVSDDALSETSKYQIIEASTRTIKYQTVYYGGLAPEINVETIYGYTIDSVSNNVSTDMTSLFDNNMNVSSLNLTSEFDYFTVDYKKSTNQVSDSISKVQLKINSSVVFRYIKKNSMTFEISVAPVSYTITYSYNPEETYLVYRLSNTTSDTLSFGTSGSIQFEYAVYNSESGNEEKRSINYTSTDSSITFTNVPYGISLYIIAKPVNEYLKHFSSWTADNGVGVFEEYSQTFIPTQINNQEYVLEFEISVEMFQNEISDVKLILNFKKEDYQENSLWAELLESARVAGFVTLSGDKYSCEWGLDVTQLKNYVGEADQDWNKLFVDILNQYNSDFNNKISSETVNGDITSIADLLNYFWFNNIWYTESSDKNCILDSSNIIYALHDSTVTLYTDMTRAVVVSMKHETLDYKDTSKVIGVDRADYIDYSVYLSSNGSTNKGTAGTDYFIFNTAKNSISGDSDSIKEGFLIKMPFTYTVTATIQPNDSYKLEKYVYSTGNEKVSLVKKENDNSINVDTTAVGSSIQFYDSYPEIHIIAQVVIETIDINFFDGDKNIATVKIAYDKDIYDGNHSMYAHYSHTLNTLRTDANFNMPLFDLDSLASSSRLLFNHSNDDEAISYGQYKYLLSGWSGIDVDEVITTSIDLTAVWYENKTITYHVYTEGGIEESLVFYLPEGDQTLFGNTYSESLAIAPAILGIYEINNKYEFEYKYNASEQIVIDNVFNNTLASYDALYKKVSSNDGYKNVSTVTDLAGDYNVYPSIRYNIQIQQNGSDFDKLTITTFGGKYSLSMNDTGYLIISNIINGEEEGTSANMQLSISYEEFSMYSFAYWEMSDGKDLREASSLDYFKDLTVNSHYNPKIVYKEEDLNKKGKVTVNSDSAANYLPLFTNIPSKQLLNGDDSAILKYSSFGGNEAVLSVIINGSSIYEFTYTYNSGELQKLFWQITFANSNESVILQEVNKYTGIKDENGLITIEPVVYGADATFEIDGFVITNLEDVYTDSVTFVNNYSSSKVKSSESIYSETSTTGSVLKSDDYSEICTATFTTTFNTNVKSNIVNLRWQYFDASNGKWIDVIKGNTFVNYYNYGTESNPVMLVRLACEWIEVTVEFAGLNSKSKSDFTSTSYNGLDFGNATNISSNLSFINNSSTETTNSSQTLTLFKGDTITYNPTSETFVIESIGSGSITISINIGSKYFSQGWFAYTNKNLSLISSSTKVYTLESTSLSFVAWVENKVSTAVLVDTDKYDDYTNGYGDVTITVKNAKETNEIECTLDEYTYANLTLGESSKVTIVATKSNVVNHAYIQMSYNSLTETSNTLSILGSKIGSEVKILFDAEDTKGSYIIANEIQEVLVDTTIYSGYTISYAEANNIVTITLKDMFGFVANIYEIGKMPSSGKTYTPRDDYYIANIYRNSLSSITTTTKSGKTIISNDMSFNNVLSDGTNLSYIKNSNNSVIVDIFDESPYNIKISYTINATDVNGKTTTTTAMSKSTVYWKDSNTENEKSNYLYIQDIKDASSKYIALRYNLTYSCIEIEVAKSSGTYSNKLLFNSKYNLVSVSLEDITCYYPQNITADTSVVGDTQTYKSITLANYTLVINLVEKSEVTLYFKSTLPYENDLRNLNVFTWSNGNETNQTLNGSSVVFNSMYDDTGIAKAGITVPINSTIKYIGDNTIEFYNTSNVSLGKLKFTMNTNMYTYLTGNTTGWFVDTGDGYNIYSTDTYTIGSYSYGLYTMSGSEVGISSTITLTGDACIVLGLNRQEVKITIDESYWANYGLSDTDLTSVFTKTASGTTYTVPGGLVTLLPAKSTGASTGETSYVQEDNSIPTPMSIDNIRQYLYLSVEDSDSKARATKYIGGSAIEGNLLSVSSSTYKNPGYAILGKNGEYNVELTTSKEWRLVVIPTGSPSTEVNIYSGPYGKSGITATTFNFAKDGTIDLQISTSKQSIDTFTVYLSQNYLSRLYEGMSLYKTLSDGHYNLSSITFNGVNYISASEVTAKSDKARRALTGYTIMIDGKSYTDLSYVDGLATLNISSASIIKIYPIWEVVEAYTVTIDNSNSGKYVNGTLVTGLTNVITGSAVKQSYDVAFGESVTLTQNTGIKSTYLTYNVKSTGASAAYYNAITSAVTINKTTYTYMFMGFTTDSSKNRDFLSGEYSSYGMYRVVYSSGAYNLEQNTTNYKNKVYSITVAPEDGDIVLYPIWKLLGYTVTYEWNDKVYYCTSHPNSFYDSIVTYSTYLEDMPFLLGDRCDTSTGSSYFKKDDFYWTYSGSAKTNYVTLTSYLNSTGTGQFKAYYDVIHNKHNASIGYIDESKICPTTFTDSCSYCSYTINETLGSHSYGSYKLYQSLGASEGHELRAYCTRNCGAYQTKTEAHSFTKEVIEREPTCTSKGYKYYECSTCGQRDLECGNDSDLIEISSLGHDWDDFQITQYATCCTWGQGYYKCNRCGYQYTSSNDLKPTGFTYSSGGSITGIIASAHDWVWTNTSCDCKTYKTYKCSRGSATKTGTDTGSHKWGSEHDYYSTLVSGGNGTVLWDTSIRNATYCYQNKYVYAHTCSVCGKEQITRSTTEKVKHDFDTDQWVIVFGVKTQNPYYNKCTNTLRGMMCGYKKS